VCLPKVQAIDFFRLLFEVLGVTVPIFIVIAVGFLLRKRSFLDEKTVTAISKLTYDLGLSTLVFYSIVQNKLSDIFELNILKVSLSTFGVAFLVIFLSIFFTKLDIRTKGALIVTSYRSNMAFVGFPILLYAFGSLATAKASIVIALLLPLNVASTVIIFRVFDRVDDKNGIRPIILDLARDPVIIAVLLGIIFSYFGVGMPAPVEKILDILSSMAVPLALISIGASFRFYNLRKNLKLLFIPALYKLIFLPLVALFFATFVFGLEDLNRDVIVILFGMPLAVATYIQGQKYGSDKEFIASALIVTTLASLITISAWLFVMRLM